MANIEYRNRPAGGQNTSYREQLDRFIESVSFVRTHATERDSL
jgi:hypothetical protein